jgi:hypothetical protein
MRFERIVSQTDWYVAVSDGRVKRRWWYWWWWLKLENCAQRGGPVKSCTLGTVCLIASCMYRVDRVKQSTRHMCLPELLVVSCILPTVWLPRNYSIRIVYVSCLSFPPPTPIATFKL